MPVYFGFPKDRISNRQRTTYVSIWMRICRSLNKVLSLIQDSSKSPVSNPLEKEFFHA